MADKIECLACGYENPVGGVEEYSCRGTDEMANLCQVCANTLAGREVTHRATDDGRVLLTLAWAANRLRDDLRQIAAGGKVLE